jgi:hypothetical protein
MGPAVLPSGFDPPRSPDTHLHLGILGRIHATSCKGILCGFIQQSPDVAEAWDQHAPDENTAYYLKRLDECARRFAPFFTAQGFAQVFAPHDLFGFSPTGICLQTPVWEGSSIAAGEPGGSARLSTDKAVDRSNI